MPRTAKRPCRIPLCSGYSVAEGYCNRHARMRWSERAKKLPPKKKHRHNPYDKNHKDIRKIMKAKEPFCRECGRPSTDLDHIDGDPWNRDDSNLQMLCHSCHSTKTNQQDGGGWGNYNERRET